MTYLPIKCTRDKETEELNDANFSSIREWVLDDKNDDGED